MAAQGNQPRFLQAIQLTLNRLERHSKRPNEWVQNMSQKTLQSLSVCRNKRRRTERCDLGALQLAFDLSGSFRLAVLVDSHFILSNGKVLSRSLQRQCPLCVRRRSA